MADFNENRFKSKNQSWETPDELFKKIDGVFHFTRDVCASEQNYKCLNYWTEQEDCLSKTWDGINWMNPPYKNMKKFIKKAYDERDNAITVCLIPARTNTKWWHDYCMKGIQLLEEKNVGYLNVNVEKKKKYQPQTFLVVQ